jgi:hypothetical protein
MTEEPRRVLDPIATAPVVHRGATNAVLDDSVSISPP